ncbi:MAG: hypothetical protein VXW49_17975, partial [Pseudomonadota bacterium]|nr:hypothetical protein [Pseudomonadota bacterium]
MIEFGRLLPADPFRDFDQRLVIFRNHCIQRHHLSRQFVFRGACDVRMGVEAILKQGRATLGWPKTK